MDPLKRVGRRVTAQMAVDFEQVKVQLFDLETGTHYAFLMDEEEFARLQVMKGDVILEITIKEE